MTAQIKQTIVIARAQQTALVPTGQVTRRDGNWFSEFRLGWEAKAALWLKRGTASDLKKAETFANQEGYKVFVFPTSERDPLGKARCAILQFVE
jgi:hypothetical protein